jgi:hypothetical protein
MKQRYPDYFYPVSQVVLDGEGWYIMGWPYTSEQRMQDAQQRGVTWEEFHSHFPFYGLYAPEDREEWKLIIDCDDFTLAQWEGSNIPCEIPTNSYANTRKMIDLWHKYGIQSYIYFQSFESWHQYSEEYFPEDIAKNANGDNLPAWKYCTLMNPDPGSEWGKHIISQIEKLMNEYSAVDGIFYDRDDYRDYDYAHDDDVTMIGGDAVYMLGFAQEKINEYVVNEVHNRGKGVWTNGPTSIEVCKGMDGIMSENLQQATYLQYLGIAHRPLILLPYDKSPEDTELKLKIALYTGHFPSITYGDTECQRLDNRYHLLFFHYKGKEWVLYPGVLQLPVGLKGNIFQTPDEDYLVALVDMNKSQLASDPFSYDLEVKVRVPDYSEIRYCYLLSGDYLGVSQLPYLIDGEVTRVNVPAHMVSSLLLLSKKPKYEITRISSPVLVRGENGTFAINVQNIESTIKDYNICLSTPFGEKSDSFSLKPGETKIVSLDFYVPEDFSTGENEEFKVTLFDVPPEVIGNELRFSSWVFDIVAFQLPESFFVKFASGDDFPFKVVNNTNRTLQISLKGKFVEGSGTVDFISPGPNLILEPFEERELVVHIISETERGEILIEARAEGKAFTAIRSVERAMIPSPGDLFCDDFSSGNMDKWNIRSGDWDVINGVAKGSGPNHFAVVGADVGWRDYKFQVNTKIEGSGDPSIDWLKSYIFFRVQDDWNFYRFGIHGDSGYIDLYKRVDGNWQRLGNYSFYPQKNVWYNLRIEVKGSSIKGFLDGKEVINVTDDTFTYGGIGIGVLEDYMVTYYDDVVVRELRSTGDVSGDGTISAFDASQILRHVVGLTTLSGEALQVADVSGDGTVTAYDAALILQFSVGLIDKFPADEEGKILAYRAVTRRLPLMALGDEQAGQFVMPVQIDEANGGIAYELSLSYDADILEVQDVCKIHQDDLLEYRVTEGNVKIILARAEPIQGRTTEMIIVGALRPNAERQALLELSDLKINEGSIPVEVSVLEKPMVFHKTMLERTNKGDKPSVNIPIHCVIPTTKQEYLYSLNSTFQGEPLKIGDVIMATDVDGVLCGYSVVESEGKYGYMAVYGDDFRTEVDEGAKEGDELTFYINGYRACYSGLDEPAWIGRWGRKEVDLFSWVESIPLSEGWNFISFDLQPHKSEITEVLESIEGKYEVVKAANGTPGTFDPALTEYSDLIELSPSQGYWLKLKEPATLAIAGIPISQEFTTQVSQLEYPSALTSVDLWGEILLNGQPAKKRTVITVLNHAGVELGRCMVKEDGKYGFLHIPMAETVSDFTDIQFKVEGISSPIYYLLLYSSPEEGDRIRLDIKVE